MRYAIESASHVQTTVLDVGTGLAELAGVNEVRPHVMYAKDQLDKAIAIAAAALSATS